MRIELPSGTPAELSLPGGDARASRGVVVAADVGGLRPLFDDLCARLTGEHGWAVCAPEPFPGQEHLEVPARLDVVGDLDDEQQLGDLTAAAEELRQRGGVDRVAVLGFCMGGMYALKAAGLGSFDRAVAFYGMIRVPEQWRGSGQAEPLELLRKPGAAPVLGIFGGQDHWTPPDDIDELRRAGERVTVVVYDEAEHGFAHDPSRPAHRPADAADAWIRAVEFLS